MVAQKKREGTQGITPQHTSDCTLISCHCLLMALPLPSPCCASITVSVINRTTGRLKRRLFRVCLLSQHDTLWPAGQQRLRQFILAITCELWLLHWRNWSCPFHHSNISSRSNSPDLHVYNRIMLQLFMFMCTLLCKLYLVHFNIEVKIASCTCI